MATAVFDSSGSSASDAADWSNTNNWSGGGGAGGVPAAADDVAVVGGSVDVTSNETAFAAISIVSLRFHKAFTGKLGDVSNRITFDAITRCDFDSGGLETFLDSAGTLTDLIVAGGQSNANMLNVDGTTTNAEILGGLGTVTFAANMDLTTLKIIDAPSVTVVVSSGVTSLATVQQDSGLCSIAVACTTVDLYGGVMTWTGSGAIVTLNTHPNAVLNYNASGTVTNLNIFGGAVDFRASAVTSVTITSSELHEGGSLDLRNTLAGLWTFTNPITAKGGTLLAPLGGSITISGP